MPSKTPALRIDSQPARPTSGATPASSTAEYSPPSRGSVEEPENLILSTGLDRSAVTPTAYIYAAWDIPPGPVPTGYILEIAESNTFPADATVRVIVRTNYTTVRGLKTGTAHYVRVAAQSGSRQSAWAGPANITTAIDTVQPAAPTGVTAAFIGSGDLRVTWTNPTSPNFRHVEIRVYNDSGKTIHYETVYRATEQWIWTAAQNRERTSGVPDAAVYIELQSYSWGGLYSASTVSVTATKSRPATPGSAAASWDGASGTCTFTWNAVADAAYYTLTIDGTPRPVYGTRYAYTIGQNRQEHGGSADPSLAWSLVAVDGLDQTSTTPASGTATLATPATPTNVSVDFSGVDAVFRWDPQSGVAAFRLTIDSTARDVLTSPYTYTFDQNRAEHGGSADPSLAWSLVAVDALGQTSTTPASGTATNALPTAPSSVTISGTVATLAIAIGGTKPADFAAFVVRILRDTVEIATYRTTNADEIYNAGTPGTYQVGARVEDVFGQASDETLSSATVLDFLTLTKLRAGATYTDDLGTASSVLDALKDGNTSSGGVTYS